jgi:hypothetical protein
VYGNELSVSRLLVRRHFLVSEVPKPENSAHYEPVAWARLTFSAPLISMLCWSLLDDCPSEPTKSLKKFTRQRIFCNFPVSMVF